MRKVLDLGKDFRIGKLFYLFYCDGLWWFRFWNRYGIHAKDTRKHEAVFSERYGYKKRLHLFKWSFEILRRDAWEKQLLRENKKS